MIFSHISQIPHPHLQEYFFQVLEEMQVLGFDRETVEELIRDEAWEQLSGIISYFFQNLLKEDAHLILLKRVSRDVNCSDMELSVFIEALLEQRELFSSKDFLQAMIILVMDRPQFVQRLMKVCFLSSVECPQFLGDCCIL